MRLVTNTAVLIAAFFFAGYANANMVYSVHSTSVENCAGAPHGLWTNNDIKDACGNYFDIQSDSTFTLNNGSANESDWFAELLATAKNPFGTEATINLTFKYFAETYAYKQEGGIPYDPMTDDPDIDFFESVAGTIDIGPDTFHITGLAGGFAFQFGPGANAKSPFEYGGSAWIISNDFPSTHWDLNLTFEPINVPLTNVPEPSAWLLLVLALGGPILFRKRQNISI